MRLKTGHRYQDMGPFRAFNIDTILGLHMEDENFGWNIEMQLKAVTQGLNTREIELPYRKRQSGTSRYREYQKRIKAGIIIIQTVLLYWSVWLKYLTRIIIDTTDHIHQTD